MAEIKEQVENYLDKKKVHNPILDYVGIPVISLVDLANRRIMSRKKAYDLEKDGKLKLIRNEDIQRTYVAVRELERFFGLEKGGEDV